MATAGIQRVLNGLEVFQLFESFANPLQRSLLFTFFITPLYYLFFHNLIFKNTPYKRIVLHFTIPLLIAILSSIFNPNLVILKAIFLLYSSVYIVFTGLLIREKLFQIKNYKELIHFQSIKNWTLIMFGFSFLIYFLANYIFLNYSNEEGQNVLINFYNITSLIWLFIIGYILKNPVILYGDAMKLIQSGYLDTHTIDSLAIKCLFTNRSTFYKNFKKQTGFSPTEYQIAASSD
jgi:AraC-like DNA-binding protein